MTCQISLNTLLDALHANMKRYPIDILSIYRCLSDVGKRHEDYIEALVPTLLKLDKRYLPKEANVEDQMCKYHYSSLKLYLLFFNKVLF
jgi:integrator complex subunit 4